LTTLWDVAVFLDSFLDDMQLLSVSVYTASIGHYLLVSNFNSSVLCNFLSLLSVLLFSVLRDLIGDCQGQGRFFDVWMISVKA
jgi:hypothetical protein